MKTVVIPVPPITDAEFYLPIVTWAWNKFGYKAVVFVMDGNFKSEPFLKKLNVEVIKLPNSNTVSPLDLMKRVGYYSGFIIDSADIVIGEFDLLPLVDLPTQEYISGCASFYGGDYLRTSSEVLCKMTGRVKGENKTPAEIVKMIEEDITNSDEWYIGNMNQGNTINASREIRADGLLHGRVDRANWKATYKETELIDARLPAPALKDEHIELTHELLNRVFGSEPSWFYDLCNSF